MCERERKEPEIEHLETHTRSQPPFYVISHGYDMDITTSGILGFSGSGDVLALCCDFGRHVPRVVSALSFKLKAETSISRDSALMQWHR